MSQLVDTSPAPVAAPAPPSFLDSITWGTTLPTNAIDVYFAEDGEMFDGKTSVGWGDYEIQQAMLAFEQFSNVADVTFNIVHDQSKAELTLVNKENANYLGYFNPPGTNGEGIGVFNQGGTGWDEELEGTGGLEQGGYGFITLLHEFGHALGMAHPHDTGGTSTIWEGVTSPFDSFGTFDLNQGIYTTMTYNDGWQLHPSGENTADEYGWQGTMMGFDIALLQQLYGANTSFANGDTKYVLPDANGTGTYFSCIWDTGGDDQIVYRGKRDAVIDLRAAHLQYAEGSGGYISFAERIYGGFTIANGVVIEDAVGGSGDDGITGNDAGNLLKGKDGSDTLFGLAGEDRLTGGDGNDTLSGGDAGDLLAGGCGADRFVYAALSESGSGRGTRDRISDFESGEDALDLHDIDARSGGTADDDFTWIDSEAFHGSKGELRWKIVAQGVVVQGDYDGDGIADFKILLHSVNTVERGDFSL